MDDSSFIEMCIISKGKNPDSVFASFWIKGNDEEDAQELGPRPVEINGNTNNKSLVNWLSNLKENRKYIIWTCSKKFPIASNRMLNLEPLFSSALPNISLLCLAYSIIQPNIEVYNPQELLASLLNKVKYLQLSSPKEVSDIFNIAELFDWNVVLLLNDQVFDPTLKSFEGNKNENLINIESLENDLEKLEGSNTKITARISALKKALSKDSILKGYT